MTGDINLLEPFVSYVRKKGTKPLSATHDRLISERYFYVRIETNRIATDLSKRRMSRPQGIVSNIVSSWPFTKSDVTMTVTTERTLRYQSWFRRPTSVYTPRQTEVSFRDVIDIRPITPTPYVLPGGEVELYTKTWDSVLYPPKWKDKKDFLSLPYQVMKTPSCFTEVIPKTNKGGGKGEIPSLTLFYGTRKEEKEEHITSFTR